jgi:hypothetical protein
MESNPMMKKLLENNNYMMQTEKDISMINNIYNKMQKISLIISHPYPIASNPNKLIIEKITIDQLNLPMSKPIPMKFYSIIRNYHIRKTKMKILNNSILITNKSNK